MGKRGYRHRSLVNQLHVAGWIEDLMLAKGAIDIDGTDNSLANVIIGNESNNIFTGGDGNDRFVFGPNFGKDVITDFHIGDTMQFDHTVFASVSAILAQLSSDSQSNALISTAANKSLTVEPVSTIVLRQHSDAFELK
jgi:Ca2+-binding RTX toxin-like protein